MKRARMSSLGDDGASIVMSHDVFWANHDIVASLDGFAWREVEGIPLNDLLDDRLRNAR